MPRESSCQNKAEGQVERTVSTVVNVSVQANGTPHNAFLAKGMMQDSVSQISKGMCSTKARVDIGAVNIII